MLRTNTLRSTAHHFTHVSTYIHTYIRMHTASTTSDNTYGHSDVELSVGVCHSDAGRWFGASVASHVNKMAWKLDRFKHDIVVRQKVDLELTEEVPSPLCTEQTVELRVTQCV